jgi:AAA family ATP:ADP antiporter
LTSNRSGNDAPLLAQLLALPRERVREVAWSAAFFFFVMASYFVLQPLRDTLARRQQDDLSRLVMVTAGAMLVAQLTFSAVASRVSRKRLVPIAFRSFQWILAGFATLFLVSDPFEFGATATFYVFVNVFNLFALSLFWIAQVDAWSEADARRVFGIVALGGTVAGIVGPQVSKWLYASLDVPIGGVVLLSVVLLEVAQWAARRGKSAADASTKPASDGNVGKEALEGIVATARSPYLLGIAGYLLLYSFTSTFLWFGKQHFSHIVYGDDDKAAAQFFANLRSISEGVTLALQLFVAGRFMNRFGVGIALCAVPVFTFAGFSSVWIAPTLQSLAIFEVGRQALQYAISRPAKEVLFTVVSRAEKSKAKAFIDTVVYRLGDAMAAGVKEHTSAEKGLFVPIPAAVVWTVVALVLGRAQAKRAAAEASTAASK